MNDFLETVGILIAFGSISSVLILFVLFMRAIGRREREAIEQYQRGNTHE